jgi:acetyltransferase-like isoleucine patch superfamily enzyme
MLGFISKIFGGSKSEKDIKTLSPVVEQINQFFQSYKTLSNDELRGVLGVTIAPIRVGRYVPIGTGTLLLPGTDIGEGAAIHAMSAVAGTLPAWTICGGNPAKPLGPRSRHLLAHADLPMLMAH